jgi:hypothetical protein
MLLRQKLQLMLEIRYNSAFMYINSTFVTLVLLQLGKERDQTRPVFNLLLVLDNLCSHVHKNLASNAVKTVSDTTVCCICSSEC